MKLFDFAIGNPPFHEAYEGESSGANSVYDKFLDAAFEVAKKVEMVHPARFLFNAGSTPKCWNEKMLADPHYKIIQYESNSNKFFPMLATPITGGIVISYHDAERDFGEIGTFTQFAELNSILSKIENYDGFSSISATMVSSFAYHFTETLMKEHPEVERLMSKGHAYDLKSNVFDRLKHIFSETKREEEQIAMLGRKDNQRTVMFIPRKYINQVSNLDKYKIFLSKADGAAGQIGFPIPARIIGESVLGIPGMGSTESFLSIGHFDTEEEAKNCAKYVKSKFARALLGVLKVTQDITPAKWKYVPLQDFTDASDINWTKSIPEIDRQLYSKYDLDQSEIDFIETHVKEME